MTQTTYFELFLLRVVRADRPPRLVRKRLRRSDLRVYQARTVDLIKRVWHDRENPIPGVILAYDMGSGKTVSTLTALRDLISDGVVKKALIVAPLLVAETVWPVEIGQWEHLVGLPHTLIRGDEDRRRELVGEATPIHIINKELLPWLWQTLGNGARWRYDCLVIDEASMLKNGKKRTKLKNLTRFGVLAQARRKASGVIELTGTPAPNGLQNLWGLSYIVDRGQRLGESQKKFMDRWFDVNPYSFKVTEKAGARGEILGAIKDIMYSLDPKDYTEMPEIVYLNHHVVLPSKTLREYARFKKTLYSEEYDVEAVNSAVLTNKLLQFANGSMYQEDGADVWIHDLKLDCLKELVEELDGTPLLVAYSYKFDLRRIRSAFPDAVVLNETKDALATIRDWDAGKIGMLLAHPLSAGHGLNMQYGSNQACWYGLNSDLELYQQFNKRLARPGGSSRVFLHHIIARDTDDENVLPVLSRKDSTQQEVLDATRIDFSEAA